jgi:ATP-dependent protease ClpP protease subunit
MVHDSVEEGDEVEIRALFDGQEKEYHIIINSPGGSGSVCNSILNHIQELKDSGAKITTEVSGQAFSAGALIWAMGDTRIVHKYDMLMFHAAALYDPNGNRIPKEQIKDEGIILLIDTLNAKAVSVLEPLIGRKKAEEMLIGETWLTGKQAFEMGLATILK